MTRSANFAHKPTKAAVEGESDAAARRALIELLAMRGAAADDERKRLERRFLTGLCALPLADVPAVCGPLRTYWPQGFGVSRVRAVLHVLFDSDSVGGDRLFQAVFPLLASEARCAVWLRVEPGAALGVRLRAANVCRAIATAAAFVGSVDMMLEGEREAWFVRTLTRLFRDRDPEVGARAAWAVGLLMARGWTPAHRLAEQALEQPPGLLQRRGMIAQASLFAAGEMKDEPAFIHDLMNGRGKQDAFARATVIQALRLGVSLAPDAILGLVADLVPQAPVEVLTSVAVLAHWMSDAEQGAALKSLATTEAGKLTGEVDPALAFWLGQRHPIAGDLLTRFATMRQQLKGSIVAATGSTSSLLEEAQAAAQRLSGRKTWDGASDVQRALDVVLHQSTLMRDASLAQARSTQARAERRQQWSEAAAAVRTARLAGWRSRSVTPPEARDRLRLLALSLDAWPRESDLGWDDRSALNLAQSLAAAGLANEDPSLDRPLAVALAAVLDPLLGREVLEPAQVLSMVLLFKRPQFVRALAGATSIELVAVALSGLVALRERIDRLSRQTLPSRQEILDLQTALATLAQQVTQTAGPLAVLAQGLLRTIEAIAPLFVATERLSATEHATRWAQAAEALVAAQHEGATALGLRATRGLATAQRLPSFQRCLSPQAILTLTHADSALVAQALHALEPVLPPWLDGLFPLLFRTMLAVLRRRQTERQARSDRPFTEGTKIGDHVVVAVLGSGAMGHCLKVRRRTEVGNPKAREWVMKVPKPDANINLFRKEARALLDLMAARHPAIVRFHSFTEGLRYPYLLMDFALGETLARRIQRQLLSRNEVIAMAKELASGLASAHSLPIGHYDIKPDNIILAHGSPAHPVLVDWGLAGLTQSDAGTLLYMAPECFQASAGRRQPLLASDIYALGCVLYESLTGQTLLSLPLDEWEAQRHPGIAQILSTTPDPSGQLLVIIVVELSSDHALLQRRIDKALPVDPLAALVASMVSSQPSQRPLARPLAERLASLDASSAAVS